MITQEYLTENYLYEDGHLYSLRTGKRVGSKNGAGRWQTCIKGKYYYLHRLIFLYHKGYLPETPNMVDHEDTNLDNNRIDNLREANPTESSINRVEFNSTGFKGVDNFKGRWRAKIRHLNKHIHIGYFDTAEQASEAYNKKAKELFGEFCNLNVLSNKLQ
jgi:hypothetical protein